MKTQSAGILLYRKTFGVTEVLLVHPGGPYWAKRDDAAWSVPKGEIGNDEDSWSAAKREFLEETSLSLPEVTKLDLGEFRVTSSKIATAWAVNGDADLDKFKSNDFEMEWPPKSGRMQQFPEVDKAGWFTLAQARVKLVKGQVQILDKLAEVLGIEDQTNSA
ncbi:MAG TPA: NUDIX domain-containing protein [Candidatus Saccharimonadales bacterium]